MPKGPKPTPVLERIMRRIEVDQQGCWNWTGSTTLGGYGVVQTGGHFGTNKLVHREVYQLLAGPIAEGYQIDHLCRNRRCANPQHLEPVTPKVNSERGLKAQQTHCIHGHAFDEANTYRRPNGTRHCRTCGRLAKKVSA